MADLAALSARELLAGYERRDFSPVEVVEELAERIAAVEPQLCAFTTLCLERAREEARAAERAFTLGLPRGPLAGVPFAAKDLFDTAGVRTTYGSPIFGDHVPSTDAAAVRRTREAGGILVGKTSTHEFAWGITSVNPRMGTPRNPWAPDRISGGSSGGSAVALAAGETPLALGSDTGGSIRVPSAFCGVVGLKPTYGRISLAGAWPLARSLDHAGPMARTPADAALYLRVLAGADPDDPATEDVPLEDDEGVRDLDLGGLVVGICPDLNRFPLTARVQAAFDAAARTLEELGAHLVEVDLPEAGLIYPAFGVIQRSEALFTHVRAGLFPSRREEYGMDVRGRLELASAETLENYLTACADRQRIRAAFARLFSTIDLLLMPVAATSPPTIDEQTISQPGDDAAFRESVLTYTVPQDLVGLPACAVRAGFDELAIPVGVQLTGPPWSEPRVLRAAHALHAATAALQARSPLTPAGASAQAS
jgi:aspartyl-tRNA(Asn)/glutamyl-tRNA(Gln) amidotransferase subunit A